MIKIEPQELIQLLARRIEQKSKTWMTPVNAEGMARYLIDSGQVTQETMFGEDPDRAQYTDDDVRFAISVLVYLDERGGLGEYKHNMIREVLKRFRVYWDNFRLGRR